MTAQAHVRRMLCTNCNRNKLCLTFGRTMEGNTTTEWLGLCSGCRHEEPTGILPNPPVGGWTDSEP